MNTKIEVTNDFLEFILSQQDDISEYLRLSIIKRTIPELDPQFTIFWSNQSFLNTAGKKEILLDFIAKNTDRTQNAIEFHVTEYHKEQALRFQMLGFQLANREEARLGSFDLAETVYQIVFLTDRTNNATLLINHFRMRSPEGYTSDFNRDIPVRVYVTIPLAIDIKEEKGLENMDDFEQFCYVLATQRIDAILLETNPLVQALLLKKKQLCHHLTIGDVNHFLKGVML